jgi:hypothetical protein
VAEITDEAALATNHVGFGSWVKGDKGPKQIKSYEDVFELDHSFLVISTPQEAEVSSYVAPPIVAEQSGLAAWNALMSSPRGVGAALKETKGTVGILQRGGEESNNYGGWAPFSPNRNSGTSLSNQPLGLQALSPLPLRDGKGNFPQGNLSPNEKKKLAEKVRELAAAMPTKRHEGQKELYTRTSPVASTPLVHYYQSRYIASILKDQAANSFNLKTRQIERIRKMDSDLGKSLDKSIEFSPDDRTGIDAIFDMMPVPTVIRYTGRKDTDAIANSDLMGIDGAVDIGLLQKTYSLLDNKLRIAFEENVAAIIRSLPHDFAINEMARKVYSIQPELLEPALVWIEEMDLQQAKTTVNTTVGEIDYQMKRIHTAVLPLTSMISIPGWMILQYSTDGGKAIISQMHEYLQFDWPRRGDPDLGIESVIQRLEDDERDEEAEEVRDAWYEILEIRTSIYDGTIIEMTADTIKIDFEDLLDGETILFDRKGLLSNEMEKEELVAFRGAYGFTGRRKLPEVGLKSSRLAWQYIEDPMDDEGGEYGLPMFKEHFSFISATESDPGVELSYPGVMPDSDFAATAGGGFEASVDPIEEDLGLSRAFQALGAILMALVKDNGVKHGLKEKSTSQFDKTVTALLGTYAELGPATYHAQVHHQMLYEVTHAALRNADDAKGLVTIGQAMVFEQFSKNPAKLMCIWMMVDLGLIDIGEIDAEGKPQFFKIPRTTLEVELAEKSLMNTLALVALSYYRLSFSPLRMRSKGPGKLSVDLKKLWPSLVANARKDPPEAYAFAGIMRFLANSEKKLKIDMPAWMPVLPEDLASLQRTRRSSEVPDFIQWAYGSNPLSVEAFCEVAAAYHAAKVCSWFKPGLDEKGQSIYAAMVSSFIDAVEQERGEGFLMAVLMAYGQDKEQLAESLKAEPIPDSTIQFSEIKGRV